MFRVFILLVCVMSNAFGEYHIIFDNIHSPPPTPPKESSMYYSVPLNQEISKPIFAYLMYSNGTRVTDGPLSNSVVHVLTIDKKSAFDKNYKDIWKDSGGRLCQNAVSDKDYPDRLDKSRASVICGSSTEKTLLTIPIFRGRIILDGIFHQHTTVPPNERILRIISPSIKIFEDCNPFLITVPADSIEISQQPPGSVIANRQFQLTAKIRDQSGNVVTTGLDSIAYVQLTVPYYYKTFYHAPGKMMMLKSSTVHLSGENFYHQSNNDLVIRRRASAGIVTFKDVRIRDIATNLQLNLTMTMGRYPWTRIPNCASCYDDTKLFTLKSNGTEVTFPDMGASFYAKIKSMAMTTAITVTPQTASHLTLASKSLDHWKQYTDPKTNTIAITRNVPIPGGFTVYILDSQRERIFSGPDASQDLKYATIPSGVCISSDATPKIEGGSAHLFVSICQVVPRVKVIVSLGSKSSISFTSPNFVVNGVLRIAHLGDFGYSGDGVQIDSHINNFIAIAVQELNDGIIASQLSAAGFKLNLLSYNTDSDVSKGLKAFYNLTNFGTLPENAVHGIISSAGEDITLALNPQFAAIEMPYISTSNSGMKFSDKSQFPYFNRVCWSDSFIIASVVKLIKERQWNMIVVLRENGISLGNYFRNAMKVANIDIDREITFPVIPEILKKLGTDIPFKMEMKKILKWRCRVIFLFATAEMQPYILRAAYLAKLDTDHGYQWVIIGHYIWEFPFQNRGVCSKGPKTCTTAFRGTLLVGETYNVSPNENKWVRVMNQYFSADKFRMKGGIIRYRSLAVSARMALGYDATLLLVYTLLKLVLKKRSFTGYAVNQNLRNIQVEGLTGRIRMNSFGDRVGYLGFLGQVNTKAHNFHYLRMLLLSNYESQLEIPFESNPNEKTITAQFTQPYSPKYNLRSYTSRTGMVSLTTQRVIEHPNESWPSEDIIRFERILPVFTCDHDCGYNPTEESDVNMYDSGKCTHTGECECRSGYAGKNCTAIVCQECRHGECISPEVCQCRPGWYGYSCKYAICEACVHGICEWPGRCKCFSNSVGWDCSVHVAAIVIPLILGLIFVSLISYFCAKKFLEHTRQKSALSNLNWVVYWPDVECCQPEISFISRTSVSKRSLTLMTTQLLETYKWKNEKWYVKHIPNITIGLDDVNVRLEMVELTKVKHINLITFAGACLTAPHVSFLLGLAHKGSLNDVLHLASFDLGWEFRYSFMKDICTGMRYLHEETRIGSHGRLKSYNCLIDGHWTVKISGFGAPSIRYGRYRLPREAHSEDLKGLLWTAPELLENATCLDDIKCGTKDGDVYSFAIILSEILSWADPYEYELDYISEKALLDLIKEPFNPENHSTRLKWKELGGTSMLAIRPILREEHLAQTVLRRKMTRHILAEAWDQVPSARPSFRKLLLMLEECYPASGGLIDNLINLLSSYSNNLELIVLERTREIEESKEKSEHLLNQLLPRNIADQLKQGRKVMPELFECVTVFFSDIVDFGEILMESTPFEIVEFLNEMYNAFDETIHKYNVYKVETISDTYIVVSGLPERIGPQHAGEIATMALDLLSLITTFQIPHRRYATLQLRIGIHSGPVVSGIVGILMPKYCLFGDTVNTASRMESSSISLRIQISDSTASILKELGGYQLDCRGWREVKGRGLMCTWWLEGRDGFDKPLPDKSLAISLSRHRFK